MFNKLVLSIALLLAMPLLGQIPVNPPGGGGGSGTVTSFSAGNLTPLFSTATANPSTTPSLSFAAATAAQNTVLAGPTSGTGAYSFRALTSTDVPFAQASLKPSFAFWGFGTSYMVGKGVANTGQQSGFSLLAAQTPAPAFNYGSPGATAPVVGTFEVFPQYAPDLSIPSTVFLDAGPNDGGADTCGGTTTSGCALNYTLTMNAIEAWLAIPQQFRIIANQGTLAGSWAVDNVIPVYANPLLTSRGLPIVSNSAATITFSVPSSASTTVGLTYRATNSNTGTFTVTVDGSIQTSTCTGTTTFDSAPCLGVSNVNDPDSYFRQAFTVTPNQAHTVVVSAANANVGILSVDWIPPAANANTNTVFMMGPNASFQFSATYETLSTNVVNALHGAGLPVYYVSQISGTPGVNATTDVATSATLTCSASNAAGHPNTCGYAHMAQTVQNVASTAGYVFSSYNANENTVNGIFTAPISVNASYAAGPRASSFSNFGGTGLNPCTNNTGLGIDFLRGLNNSSGIGWGCDTSTGLPFSGAFVTKMFASLGWFCLQSTPSNTLLTTNAESSYTSEWCSDRSGNSVQLGISSQKIVTVAAATTIAITTGITHITGITPIATITPTAVFTSNTGGCVKLWPDAAFTWITGGNISNSGTAVVGTPIDACWSGTSWFLK